MLCRAFSLLPLLLLLAFPAAAADGTAQTETAKPALHLVAYDAQGRIMAETSPAVKEQWSMFGSWGKDTLVLHGPEATAEPLTDGEGKTHMLGDFFVAVRWGTATQQMPWPLHPSQLLYSASFKDGTQAFLRLSDESPLGSGAAEWQGEVQPLTPLPALAFARLELAGDPQANAAELRAEWDVPTWIAAADCRSLVASATQRGQDEALLFAAEAIKHVLEEYKSQHHAYPASLEQLWQGSNAVAALCPANPFAWPDPLCVPSSLSLQAPALVYSVLPAPDGSYSLTVATDGRSPSDSPLLTVL